MENIIEINGVKYQKREQGRTKHSKAFSTFMVATAMLSGGMGMPSFKEPERPDVDIVKEFELIQNKKSGLTKSQRDWVEYQFKRNFIKLES